MGAQDISWLNLISGYALLLIPIFIFSYYKTGLTKDMLWAITRMTIQLFLVGVYLEFIFTLNSWLVNLSWVLIMIAVTAYTVTDRAQLSRKLFILPVFISIFISLALVDLYLLGVVLKLNFIFEARYFIPITGMLIGNTLADMVISLNNFYKGISKQQTTYRFALANGATRSEALSLFMREAIRVTMSRGIATTAVMGLVSLPGMMTGQILGGSSPSVAIKYQILIMLTIFVSSLVTNVLTLLFSCRNAFDSMGNLRKEVIR